MGTRKPITPYDLYKIIQYEHSAERWGIISTHDFHVYGWIDWTRSPDGIPTAWLNFKEIDKDIKVCPFLVGRGYLKDEELDNPLIKSSLKDNALMCGIYDNRLYNCKSYPLNIENDVESWSDRYKKTCSCHEEKNLSTADWIDGNLLVEDTFMFEQWYELMKSFKKYPDDKINDLMMLYLDWDIWFSLCDYSKYDLTTGNSASKLHDWKYIWDMLRKWEHAAIYSTAGSND